MKLFFTLSGGRRAGGRLIAAITALVAFAGSAAAEGGPKIDMTAVAEVEPNGSAVAPAAGQPVYYYAADGGFIEGGDTIAGQKPPAAPAVADALRSALGHAGFQPAVPGTTPSLVVVYYWGSISPRRGGRSTLQRVEPSLHARLSLVATRPVLRRLEERITLRHSGMIRIDDILDRPDERDAFDLARGTRYFLVVTAYDYTALTRGEIVRAWQTKLSAPDNSGDMNETILSLAAVGNRYFGRQLNEPDNPRVPLVQPAPAPAKGEPAAEALPAGLTSAIDVGWLQKFLGNERLRYSGAYGARAEADFSRHQPAGTSALPAPLARRIAEYQQEKHALQQLLAERLQANPGADRAATVAAFNQQQSHRLAALQQSADSIRSDLTVVASRQPAPDKSIEQLLHELSAGVRAIEESQVAQQP